MLQPALSVLLQFLFFHPLSTNMKGKLDGDLDEEEKNKLNNKYIETAK
ncbi:hypothetical protein SDC9_97388 [bioreactor metagenome]|uniref:Uncharacterized protein n=1 Tax=bioreactor metagenome TaxID=1076179 RepID=A0A645ACH2_9ZZZZ